jgi:hypothetical protein
MKTSDLGLVLLSFFAPTIAGASGGLLCTLWANPHQTTDGVTLDFRLPEPRSMSQGDPEWQALKSLAMDPYTSKTFNSLPRWIQRLNVGAFSMDEGVMVILFSGEEPDTAALTLSSSSSSKRIQMTLIQSGYQVGLACRPKLL